MKICKNCKEEKSLLEFSVCKSNPDGYYHLCKHCKNKKRNKGIKDVRLNLLEKECLKCGETKPIENFSFVNIEKQWRQSYCRTCINKAYQEKRKLNPRKEQVRKFNQNIKSKYSLKGKKLDIEQFHLMIVKQDNKCLICKDVFTKPCIDHCHATNEVRGLLCSTCNTGLGMFKDNIENLKNAIAYLENSRLKTD